MSARPTLYVPEYVTALPFSGSWDEAATAGSSGVTIAGASVAAVAGAAVLIG